MTLQPSVAPGRDAGAAAPQAPVEGAANTGTATADGGPAPGVQTSPLGSMTMLLPIVILFGFLFFMSRGEKKKRRDLESKLKKGDRVVTRSGIIGKLLEIGDRTVRAEIAPGVNVTMLKVAVEGLESSENITTDKKDAGTSKGGKKK
jgi:preprotein translocase subunit YajC